MKKHHALVAALIALCANADAAQASAAQAFCTMTRAQGEVQSALLGSADVFTNVGDPVTGTKSITVGVRKSLSRTLQADTVNQLAQAQCEAYRLDEQLAQQADHVEQRGELQALQVLVPRLRTALAAAEASIAREETLLAAKNATIADWHAANEQAEQLHGELAAAMRRQGQLIHELPALEQPLEDLAYEANTARSKVAELSSKLTAQSGWDVALSAGTRTSSGGNGGRNGAFIAVNASMSLGKFNADQAAARVPGLTQEYLKANREGGIQTLLRARDSVRAVLVGEKMAQENFERRKALLARTTVRMNGVNTTDGMRMQRKLKVEMLGVDARLAASQARIAYLQNWLAQNGG